MRVVAMLMAGGAGTRLTVLSDSRAKPAVPFAGKFRIIDFTLSNCVNSGIYDVAVLTQYRPHSLNAHIGIGKPWDLDRSNGGVASAVGFICASLIWAVQKANGTEAQPTRFTRTWTSSAKNERIPSWSCQGIMFTRWTIAPCWSFTRRRMPI